MNIEQDVISDRTNCQINFVKDAGNVRNSQRKKDPHKTHGNKDSDVRGQLRGGKGGGGELLLVVETQEREEKENEEIAQLCAGNFKGEGDTVRRIAKVEEGAMQSGRYEACERKKIFGGDCSPMVSPESEEEYTQL